ncbi:hypothetical protein MTO96_011684 [Rhipicephalus appendiculatus]
MIVRLRANETVDSLAGHLHRGDGPTAVSELDLTNCVRLDSKKLLPLIAECSCLQFLRCLGCAFEPSDILVLLWRLRFLVEVEVSLTSEKDAESMLRSIGHAAAQYGSDPMVYGLRRMYVEVAGDHNIKILPTLLRYCPYLHNLHVHVSWGTLWKALQECHGAVLADDVCVETFTFTSELSASAQREPRAPLDLTGCATVCANVSYTKSTDSFSCVRLFDLAVGNVRGRPPRILPVQMILVAVEYAEEGISEELIRLAGLGHNWGHVRQLCLLLLPPEPSCVFHPTAGGTYRDNLHHLFSAVLKYIVELNVSSFHFGEDLDFGDLLQHGSLQCLQSLAVSLCGLRRPSALRCLAQSCPEFKDLDVRNRGRGSKGVVRCVGCVAQFRHDTDETWGDGWSPLFRAGLHRLTLTDVHDTAWLSWFIESCSPTATVRLFNSPSKLDCSCLTEALIYRSMPKSVVLHHRHLQFDDTSLLNGLRSIVSLQYMYLISEVPTADDVVLQSVRALQASLPRLLCMHVHYLERPDDTDKRMTWMRAPGPESNQGYLVRDGPCFQSCSTATFIGLAKPLYHDVQPMM